MITFEPGRDLETYLAHAVRGERSPATWLAIELLDRGATEDEVIEALLATAQREVGERWYRDELSVADEHVASGVSAAALAALASEADVDAGEGHTVVVCAEGDWHWLAAQMLGEGLRLRGTGVTVLGASTPSDVVAEFVVSTGADSVAVSCSMPVFLPGVRRLAEAVHAIGVPLLAGGRAFGSTPERARRLGADGWAVGIADANALLAHWRADPPALLTALPALDPGALVLIADAAVLAREALATLDDRLPLDAAAADLVRTDETITFLVQFVGAALLVADQSILCDHLGWLTDLVELRDGDPAELVRIVDVLTPMVRELAPTAEGLMAAGAAHLAGLVGNPRRHW